MKRLKSVVCNNNFYGLLVNIKYHMSLVMRKPFFCISKTKTQISFAVTAKLISAFVFAT